ncbi:UNVERIFIED_CONTAM: protein HEADING DATE 3B [Sesamum latifolium]|uniref:Protein HEADING DATE 3B n=1 Tax=Sesamum latifolium TaxID=2727402 RepID=A0AAW2YDX0_9LAMI
MKTVTDVTSGTPETATRKRCASVMDNSSHSSPRLGDCNEPTKIELNNEFSEDKDCLALQVGNADKRQNTSETSMENSLPGLDLTPENVASVIGQRLFWKARKTIVHQQRIFSLQIFELHRLIKVQRVIAGSPETLHENNFHPNKSSIQFPPMNKLLYVTPLDPLPSVAKPKADALKSNLGEDCGAEAVSGMLPLPTSIAEIGRLPQQLIPKPLPTPAPIPTDAKLAPWCFQPPPGNQCLSTMGGTTYGVPAPNEQGIGHFYGTSLGQGYFQPYPMPLINASGPNPEVEQMISSARVQLPEPDKDSSTSNANFAVPCQSPCKASSQQSAVVSGCGGNLHRHKGSDGQCSSATSPAERLEGEALSLFPTTPSSQALRDQSKVKVIKVVPHNRKSAPESAARIFQSIQEERKKHE